MNFGFRFLQSEISNTVEQRLVLKPDSHPDNHILLFSGTSEFIYHIPQIQPIWKQLITFCNSVLKPTRCTNVSNLFYFGMTLYMFRAVFPSIISSSNRYCCLLASKQTEISVRHACCCMYSLELLMTAL